MHKRNPLVFLILVFIFAQACGIIPLLYGSQADMVIYGDTRKNHDNHRAVVSAILELKPSLVFHLGDFVNQGSSLADWQAFNEIAASLFKNTEFYPVRGNHDDDPELFFRNFKQLNRHSWYALERQGIHFVVLDSNAGLTPDSPQYKWLEADLSSVSDKVKFKIVLLHQPVFSVVRSQASRKRLRSLLLPLFEKYGVTAVFSGHDHNYQQFLYKDIYFIVTGGGGAFLYNQKSTSPYLQKFAKEHHFCALSVEDRNLKVRVFDVSLNLIDELQLVPKLSAH